MQFRLSNCPFCGCKMWYLEAFIFKNNPIYKCKNCKEKTSVLVEPNIFKFFWIIEIFLALIFGVSIFFGGEIALLGLVFVVLVFLIFYLFTPYAVKLGYPKKICKTSDEVLKKCEEKEVYKEYREDTEKEIYSN